LKKEIKVEELREFVDFNEKLIENIISRSETMDFQEDNESCKFSLPSFSLKI